jgi:hypothetical protein
MRRSSQSFLVVLAAAGLSISCGETRPTETQSRTSNAIDGCTATLTSLRTMVSAAFGTSATSVTVRDELDAINTEMTTGPLPAAQAHARELVHFIQSKASEATGTQQVDTLVNNILCWAGLNETSYLVAPSTETQVLKTNDGVAGVQLPPNAVSEPAIITITVVQGDLLTDDDTKLDRYPNSISITSSVPIPQSTVGVCLTNIPAAVFSHLRMGHRTKDGFRIEPPAPVDFLGCPDGSSSLASQKGVRGFLRSVASLVLPKQLYAKEETAMLSGGVGGTAGEYSPFEPVDTELSFSGGVGGTAGEYIRMPAPGAPATANLVTNGVCVANEAVVGTSLEPECRPRVLVKTANGTILQNVPVTWTIASGGGLTAPEDPTTRVCGAFGTTASNTTNVNGKAGVCWKLGPAAGANSLVANVTTGGDAPPGVTFVPSSETFDATATRITPVATATGETATYDGFTHPGSGTCSDGLNPVFTYSGGSVPIEVGEYTLTVTCGAGSNNANTATATATINITIGGAVITINCPASISYTGSALTPCSATISGPGFNVAATPSYTANLNAGTAKATVSYAGNGALAPATATREFQIARAVTITTLICPTSVVYTGSALTPCTTRIAGPILDLTETPSYAANTNVGTATASYQYAGSANYAPSGSSKFFLITRATSTTALTCPATVVYTGSNLNPCSATATGAGGLNQNIAPVYSPAPVRDGGSYAASATFAGDANHFGSSASGAVAVRFNQVNCFALPLTSSLPPKTSWHGAGATHPVSCTLNDAQGAAVTNASGSVVVEDIGVNGVSAPVQVLTVANAFTLANGSYTFQLNTAPAAFLAGHYFRLTASWSDGSTTTGYIYLQ